MITRRKVLKAGAMGAVLISAPLVRTQQVWAQSAATFDYYISPTGDDNNSGTLSSPWSITALNSKKSTYAGKRVGFLPGTYQYGIVGGVKNSLYSMMQGIGSTNAPIFAVQGGPSSSQVTYLASSDSSGVYSARTATISGADPASGTLPTTAASIMGQWSPTSNVTAWGNVTIDGLVIKNFTFAGLVFNQANGMSSLNIQNCEVAFGQNVVSNNNPGAIWLSGANGVNINNCLVHDLTTNDSGNMQSCGVIQFDATGAGTTITNCTFYNCCAISNKDGWQPMNVSYCYCGWGAFGSPYSGSSATNNLGGTIQNYLGPSGATLSFHHNILIGPLFAFGESSQANEATVKIYSNTFYKPSGIGGMNRGLTAFSDLNNGSSGGTGTFQFYNNLVYAADGRYDGVSNSANPAAVCKNGATSGGTRSTLSVCDYNAYGSGMTFGDGYGTGQYAWSLAYWQGLGYSWDGHSVTLSSNPFSGQPAEAVYTTFAISGPAATAGMGGAPCGAVDGTGLVGCNFAGQPVPNAPVLSIS